MSAFPYPANGVVGQAAPDRADLAGVIDGSGNLQAVTAKTVGSTQAASVAVVDGSGNQITSFGGGTQYTEGDTDATITGTAMMIEGAGNALVAAPGTAADGLLVNLGSNNDVTLGTATGTPTQTVVASSASSVSIIASDAGRKNLIIWNDSASATLYLRFNASAATNANWQEQLFPGARYEMLPGTVYTGEVRGIWSAAVGNARITQYL